MVEQYLRCAQVATLLRVTNKTVARWAREGYLPHTLTMGGHRRFPMSEIVRLAMSLERPVTQEP